MKTFLVSCVVLLSALVLSSSANAGVYGDDLTRCLVSSASAQDRLILARWVGVAIVQHQKVAPLARTSQKDLMGVSIAASDVAAELMGSVCFDQAMNALKYEGEASIDKSFEYLVGLAIEELMQDAEVRSAFAKFHSHFQQNLPKVIKKNSKN